jgi:uncharacterized RDD family membrane protein YckC
MKSKFQPEVVRKEVSVDGFANLEDLDASEQMFAASLEAPLSQPVFTVEEDTGLEGAALRKTTLSVEESNVLIVAEPGEARGDSEEQGTSYEESDAWKQEVTARVSRYRSRRPRTPRYPSLLLKFESVPPPELPLSEPQSVPVNLQAVALEAIRPSPEPETTARVLEFPRSTMAPPRPLEELAEPVPERPRILEVAEVPALPPALGGILIESVALDEPRRPGFEIPLQAAPMTRRVLAAVTDMALILCALAEFAYVFVRVTHIIPPVLPATMMATTLGGVLWAAYQYAFLVYAGSTPGLALSRLRLSCFDGGPVHRKTRRWRALASMLSAVSLGLGYLWVFLDEDQLCWHDRITTTYMAPKPAKLQIP